jgi:arabinose-5-phosphate isomerase
MLDLFEKKRQYLNFFFDHIDKKKAKQILEILSKCKNNIIFTGIGKSAIIANKIAMTMLSTGSKALFLPAIDALHGDIAIISEEDVFVVLSKSGETDEILNLIPFVKKRKTKVVGIISNEKSRLAKMCDYYINLPVEKELCPYNLAPTTSTCVQLIFGDILTVALMKKKNFSVTQYALNHPAGAIGKQITLTVEDLMITKDALPTCFEEDLIKDVIHILSSKKCGCLLIIDDKNKLKGIFTDGDLRRLIQNCNFDFFNRKVKDVMIKAPIQIKKQVLAIDAMRLMEKEKQIMMIPVIENQKLVGLIRMHDIIQSGLKSLSL